MLGSHSCVVAHPANFVLKAEKKNAVVCAHYIFLTLVIGRHLGQLHNLAAVTSAAVSMMGKCLCDMLAWSPW